MTSTEELLYKRHNLKVYPLTIDSAAAGTSISADIFGEPVVGIYTSTDLTGTQFKFQASRDGSTFVNISYLDCDYSVTAAADKYIALEPEVFFGVRTIKLAALTSTGGAAQQDAPRTLYLITKTLD